MAREDPDPTREEPEPLEQPGADESAQEAPPSPEEVAEEAIEAFDEIEADVAEALSRAEPDFLGGEDFALETPVEFDELDPVLDPEPLDPEPLDDEDLLGGLEENVAVASPATAEEDLPSAAAEDLFDFEGYLASRPTRDPDGIELRELGEVLDEILETADNPDYVEVPEPQPELVAQAAAPGAGVPEPQHPFHGGGDQAAAMVHTTVVTTGSRFAILVLLVVGGLTLVNAAVVAFSWAANSDLEASMRDIGDQVVQTARQVRFETAHQAEEIESLLGPVASIDVEHRRTFDSVEQDLGEGRFGEARRRLYSLLAITDRLDESVRAIAEARARFLLADAFRLEARALDPDSWGQNP